MEIRKILSSKSMKFLTLLLTSLLIASASAAVYYTINWEPRVTVTNLFIGFTNGSDTPAGSTVNQAWARLLLKSYPNATLTYEKGLNISNTDSANHRISLRHVTISPVSGNADVANWDLIRFTLIARNGTIVTTFQYTRAGNTWNTPATTSYYVIPGNQAWTLKVETLSSAAATVGKVANLQIALDVQE